jgi:hypothetical protein
MANDKKSILKEALTDYNEIMEAAKANAKNKLAEEFPDNFNNLLKEELQNKNKSAKESYKKLDEAKESGKDDTEQNKETVMKTQVKEAKQAVKENTVGKPFDKKPKAVAQVEEDVKITDTVGDGDPFKEKAKKAQKIEEEREKDFVGDVESDTPNLGKSGEPEKGKVFTEKVKPESGKPISNLKEEFDITGLDTGSVGTALENADEDDEILTMEQIEEEIASMENLGEELSDMGSLPRPELPGTDTQGEPTGQEGDPFKKALVDTRNRIDELIQNMGKAGEPDGTPPEGMNTRDDVTNFSEQKNQGGKQSIPGRENGGPTQSMIDEVGDEGITDDDVRAVLGAEKPVDEQLGISHSANKGKLATIPGNDYVSPQQLSRRRPYGVEESKKLTGLIEENKKLTKKLNEIRKYKESVATLVEGYKTALGKYRNQLKEMAIFNTNLAHVNNLLVNEELALTQDDKVKIINEFKKISTIVESQNKYKAVLTEMKKGKKTITETVERKAATSIQPSSKQKLDEVVEKTVYENDEHIKRIKRLMEYVERGDKKNNL